MENVIIIAVLVLIVGLALLYVIRAKKRGKKCIGCPSESCFSKDGGCGGNCSACVGKTQK